jgi:MFS family permease
MPENNICKHSTFNQFQRWLVVFLCGGALSLFILGHRFATYFQGGDFFPKAFNAQLWLFWVFVVLLYLVVVALTCILLIVFEKDFTKKENDLDFLSSLGAISVRNGVVLTGVLFVACIICVFFDSSLINVWDVLFIFIFLGLYYIGTFMYFYYSANVKLWAADDPRVELEKLKLEYGDQRMYLRIFLWITVSFFVSQVFVVLKTKFEPYLKSPEAYAHFQPIMVINAIQIVFLLIAISGLIFSQIMRRMEEVKLTLKELKL